MSDMKVTNATQKFNECEEMISEKNKKIQKLQTKKWKLEAKINKLRNDKNILAKEKENIQKELIINVIDTNNDYKVGDKITLSDRDRNIYYLNGFGHDSIKAGQSIEVIRKNGKTITVSYPKRVYNRSNLLYESITKTRRVPYDRFKLAMRGLLTDEEFKQKVTVISRDESIENLINV